VLRCEVGVDIDTYVYITLLRGLRPLRHGHIVIVNTIATSHCTAITFLHILLHHVLIVTPTLLAIDLIFFLCTHRASFDFSKVLVLFEASIFASLFFAASCIATTSTATLVALVLVWTELGVLLEQTIIDLEAKIS
jgi:hypothetical protein